MIAQKFKMKRIRTATEALGLGFFYLGTLAFFLYALLELFQSGVL